MIKVAYFLHRYSEQIEGQRPMPKELADLGFRTQQMVYDTCYPALNDGRDKRKFDSAISTCVGGFRSFDAGKKGMNAGHPHPEVLSRFHAPANRRDALWNDIKHLFVTANSSESDAKRSNKTQDATAEVNSSSRTSPVSEDPAEDAVQNLRREVEVRQKQSLFRRKVLQNFSGKCCITGISEQCLLVASHIKPWADHVECRLDVRNGLLLSVTYDKLFDRGLITFADDLSVIVVDWVDELSAPLRNLLHEISGRIASKPATNPRQDYLAFHRARIFKKRQQRDALE